MAVPSHAMREVAHRVAAAMTEPTPLVTVAKGLESGTLKRMSQVIQEETGLPQVAALSGPSHAEEVARRKPTAVAAAANQINMAEFVQEVFSCDFFRVYTNTDLLGVEMIRFGTAMGGQVESFFGLSGVGDLITTCFSPHGRNRAFGERIARGMSVQDALKASTGVVEGYLNTKSIHELAAKLKIDMPVTEAVYNVLYRGENIRDTVISLMTREPKSESSTGQKIKRWLKLKVLRLKVSLMT